MIDHALQLILARLTTPQATNHASHRPSQLTSDKN